MFDEKIPTNLKLLEKIVKELKIANRLKFFELVLMHPSLNIEFLIKQYEKAIELENQILQKE